MHFHRGTLINGLVDQAFENTSTSVAASSMRNALNNLADTVTDEKEKKVCGHIPTFEHTSLTPPQRFETEMDNFFALFRRYLNDKCQGQRNRLEQNLHHPRPSRSSSTTDLANSEAVEYLSKLAVA